RDHAGHLRRGDSPLPLGSVAPPSRLRARPGRGAGLAVDVADLSDPADPRLSRTVSVALPLPMRRAFTYAVPDSLPMPAPGVRVRVPLSERVLTGVVVEAPAPPASAPPTGALRDVLAVLDEEPVCPPELLATAARVADRFFASTGEVLKSALPARLPASGSVRYRITERGALSGGGGASASTEQRAILERLAGGESVRVVELPGEGAARRDALRALEERGLVRAVSAAKPRTTRVEVAYAPGVLA